MFCDTVVGFASSGIITIIGGGTSQWSYSYNETTDNKNGRSFQSFSTQAKDILKAFDRYQKHVDYYGRHDYADHIMQAGFETGKTNMVRGNLDFSQFDPRGEEHGGMFCLRSIGW